MHLGGDEAGFSNSQMNVLPFKNNFKDTHVGRQTCLPIRLRVELKSYTLKIERT